MKSSISERIRKLKLAFIDQLPSQLEMIRKTLAGIDVLSGLDSRLEELHRQIHTLQGSAASFGLRTLSRAADKGEELAMAVLKDRTALSVQWKNTMEELLYEVSLEISAIPSYMPECIASCNLLRSQMVTDHDRERLIYLCEDDPVQCKNLATQIRCFGFRVKAFEDLEKFRMAVCQTPPDAIVMDMIHHDRETGGADVIHQIADGMDKKIPVVFISAKSDLPARLAAVRTGSSAYFVKPANPLALCSMLQDLTSTEAPEPYRIMIVEDDPYLSEMYSSILQEAGMETRMLNDPMESLSLLSEFKPDLILMDMYMPGCNGMELAAAIRQMEAYLSIPIVFLSRETDVDLHFDARKMGGDEFLIKPIKPDHLISAVSVRAERMKLIRSFMVKDSMTGLYNHSAIKEKLSMHIELARRKNENICFAMIDIDHFKNINDNYGHPVGDQVLVSLARLLKQRLRKTDVIGRYGGEEFAVILPGCSLEEAVTLLDQMREGFSSVCFNVGQNSFSSTFSCGVASLSSYPEVDQLCNAADEAMYTAKYDGRNRIVPPLCQYHS